jgi:predicted transcriptional regulator YdeE
MLERSKRNTTKNYSKLEWKLKSLLRWFRLIPHRYKIWKHERNLPEVSKTWLKIYNNEQENKKLHRKARREFTYKNKKLEDYGSVKRFSKNV